MSDPLAGLRLRLHFVDHAYNAPSWRWDSRVNRWPGHLLWLVVNGRGTIAMRGQATYEVGPGDCFLFDMRRVHHGRNDPEQPLEVRAVGFVAADGLEREVRLLWPGQRRHRRLGDRVAVAARLEAILLAHRQHRTAEAVELLRAVLVGIHGADQEPLVSGPERLRRERLASLAEAMAADPAAPWSVSALARRAGLGREHFTRAFARLHGLPPGRFLLQVRMDRARALLRGTTDTVAEVAALVGYADPAYFSRQFTAVVGCSPRTYRRHLSGWDPGNLVIDR